MKIRTMLLFSLLALSACGKSNVIEGNALLRTRGGDVRTCAGYQVLLIPETEARRNAVMKLFENGDHGYRQAAVSNSDAALGVLNSAKMKSVNQTCDAQGDFVFSDLSSGSYFLVTEVLWDVPGSYGVSNIQGGALMKKVSVSGGATQRVVITQ